MFNTPERSVNTYQCYSPFIGIVYPSKYYTFMHYMKKIADLPWDQLDYEFTVKNIAFHENNKDTDF